MKIGSRWSAFSFVALIAGGCVAEVAGESFEDDIEEGEGENDEALGDDVDVDRWTPELAEPERIDEPAPDDAGIIAASGTRMWSLTVGHGAAGKTVDFGDGNAPDLYVKRFCGGAYRNQTPVKPNSRTPVWNSRLFSGNQTDAYIRTCYFELWDADNNAHDYGGRISIAGVVDSMIRNGQRTLSFKRTFNANVADSVVVWFHLSRS